MTMHTHFKKSFKKEYKKLGISLQERFDERFSLFVSESTHSLLNNHSLRGAYEGCRSINITGDIRAIYYMDDLTVIFIRIGTHSELYE